LPSAAPHSPQNFFPAGSLRRSERKGRSSPPVLDLQCPDAPELPDVVADKDEAESQRVRCDLQIVSPDERSPLFQSGPDAPINGCGVTVEIDTRDFGEEDVETGMVALTVDALLRSITQLGDRDRAHADVVRRAFLDPHTHGE